MSENILRDYLLYLLTEIVNESRDETNDAIIAKALIELRDEIDSWSQDDIAAHYYVSQASISRFIKKIGFHNFNEVKGALPRSQFMLSSRMPEHNGEFESVAGRVHDQLEETVNAILNLDQASVEETVKQIREHKTIYFIGSELSMAIARLLQLKLTGMGKNAYTLFKPGMQENISHMAKPGELVITISQGQRWYRSYGISGILEQNRYDTMLWTVVKNHDDMELFDHVVYIGETKDANLGYHYLMQFLLIIYYLL